MSGFVRQYLDRFGPLPWVEKTDSRYRDFETARKFVRGLGLKNTNEWYKYCRSGKKPEDIPAHPGNTYDSQWKGYGDWLGTGNVATFNRVYRDFVDARAFVRALKMKNVYEWQKYCGSGRKPKDIPAAPWGTYESLWKSMGDWLGTGNIAARDKVYRDFEDARTFVRGLGLKNTDEWYKYCRSGRKPENIPTHPDRTYEPQWRGLGDWLGTKNVSTCNMVYRKFKEVKVFVRSLGLKNVYEWRKYCKSGNKPEDIPADPKKVYGSKWKGFGDWLGTGNIANFNKVFRDFKDARTFVRGLGLKNQKEWRTYCMSGKKPKDIPTTPRGTYKSQWKSMGDWLGTGNVAPSSRVFRKFGDARAFVRSLGLKSNDEWEMYCRSGRKPEDIPTNPHRTYKPMWKSLGDWLDTTRTRDNR